MTVRVIGLMSGTSLDGVEGVVLDVEGTRFELMAHASIPMPNALAAEFLALTQPSSHELHRSALAANALMRLYADVVGRLLASAHLSAHDILAIGAHGQTVRHQPQYHDGTGYTLQLANPALLAELTDMNVVADFRSRDVAAGGQGAPLAPVFHQYAFGRAGYTTAVLNVGGMANISVIGPRLTDDLLGFDCGPGNVLMDAWCAQHLGQSFDRQGEWAATGQVQADLLHALLAEPFFALPPPKSTGRDLFHALWLAKHLDRCGHLAAHDVQATLAELTAIACTDCVSRYAYDSKILIVCGGGALNQHLMCRLQALLPGVVVQTSTAHGLAAMHVEAAAFAWLALQTMQRKALPLQRITGSRGNRILGAIYPA